MAQTAQSPFYPQDITLEQKALTYPQEARKLTVNNPEEFTRADHFIANVDALAKQVEESFAPQIAQAHHLHKSLLAEQRRHLEPLLEAKKYVKGLMYFYREREEAERRKKEAELRELARKAEEEAKLAAALEAEARGMNFEAQAIIEEQIYSPPIILTPEVPKAKSVRFSTTWTFRIIDLKAIPREYLTPDLVKIGAEVRSNKGDTRIAGIEPYPRPEGV